MTRIAVEIDPALADRYIEPPYPAKWDKTAAGATEAKGELMGRGRTYRRPPDAIYAIVEWPMRGTVGRLLDWLEVEPGITRYAELF